MRKAIALRVVAFCFLSILISVNDVTLHRNCVTLIRTGGSSSHSISITTKNKKLWAQEKYY